MALEHAQREADQTQALKSWMAGHSYREIANELDCSVGTAYNRVQAAIDNCRPHADYDHYRSIQLGELEMARKPLRRIIVTPGTETQELATAITTLIKLQEREAKLLGLDRVTTPLDEITAMTDEQLAEIAQEWARELEHTDR